METPKTTEGFIRKAELIENIKTLYDAAMTGNNKLINFADSQLGCILNNLLDELPLKKPEEEKETKE